MEHDSTPSTGMLVAASHTTARLNKALIMLIVAVLAPAMLTGCGKKKTTAEQYPLEKLVFVVVDPAMYQAITATIGEKGVGNVKEADIKQQFIYRDDVDFEIGGPGKAMVAYTDEDKTPNDTMYQTMRVGDCYAFILRQGLCQGVIFDPDSDNPIAVSADAIRISYPDFASQIASGR